jgi:hypothetical protein
MDLDRLAVEELAMLKPLLDLQRGVIDKVGDDAVVPFQCDLLLAASICDRVRSNDRGM